MPGALPIHLKSQASAYCTINVDGFRSSLHFQSGKLFVEIYATTFMMLSASRLIRKEDIDEVSLPVIASNKIVPTLNKTNHCFLVTNSWRFFIDYDAAFQTSDRVPFNISAPGDS